MNGTEPAEAAPLRRSYILCTTPRSGSTLLCRMLRQTGIAGRPASYFRAEDMSWYSGQSGLDPISASADRFDRDYLRAVIAMGSAGTGVFGLRLMWERAAPLLANLDRLFPGRASDAARLEAAFGPTRFLHLSREDKLAQSVSLVKAAQSGLWHRRADGRVLEQEGAPRRAVYDREVIAARLTELEAADAAWERWFGANGVSPVRLRYETLARSPKTHLAALLDALGLDTGAAAQVARDTQRMHDSDSAAWIARFKAATAPAR